MPAFHASGASRQLWEITAVLNLNTYGRRMRLPPACQPCLAADPASGFVHGGTGSAGPDPAPIEYRWREVKRYAANQFFENVKQVKDAVTDGLKRGLVKTVKTHDRPQPDSCTKNTQYRSHTLWRHHPAEKSTPVPARAGEGADLTWEFYAPDDPGRGLVVIWDVPNQDRACVRVGGSHMHEEAVLADRSVPECGGYLNTSKIDVRTYLIRLYENTKFSTVCNLEPKKRY